MLGTLRRPCVCTLLERGVALCRAGLGTAPPPPMLTSCPCHSLLVFAVSQSFSLLLDGSW